MVNENIGKRFHCVALSLLAQAKNTLQAGTTCKSGAAQKLLCAAPLSFVLIQESLDPLQKRSAVPRRLDLAYPGNPAKFRHSQGPFLRHIC